MRLLMIFLLPLLACKAQVRIAYDEIQIRCETVDWKKTVRMEMPDTLVIQGNRITWRTWPKEYAVTIIGAPGGRRFHDGKNRVYECEDWQGKPVQVFVIEGERVYIYFKKYHIKLTIKKN